MRAGSVDELLMRTCEEAVHGEAEPVSKPGLPSSCPEQEEPVPVGEDEAVAVDVAVDVVVAVEVEVAPLPASQAVAFRPSAASVAFGSFQPS